VRVGVIGLGNIGGAVAENLVEDGHEVQVFDRDASRCEALAGGGAPVGGRFERSYRYTVVDSIGGGASEIQKNIIARRGLGLPPCF